MSIKPTPSSSPSSSSGSKTKVHWQLLPPPKEKPYVYPPATADSAKQDLKKFVLLNQLQYRPRRDLVSEFEEFAIELNNDEDLIDRAERRDLPSSLFENCKLFGDDQDGSTSVSHRTPSPTFSANSIVRSGRTTIPRRKSAVPNIVHDDYARRRYSLNKTSAERPPPPLLRKTISYISLESFDDFRCKHDANNSYCDHCNSNNNNNAPFKESNDEPDIVIDDMLNRKLRQSSGANVLAPHPQFGIPNSPTITYIHTFPQSDYSRVEPNLEQLSRRAHYRQSTPDLVHDDMAFRTLRKDSCRVHESKESIYGFAGFTDDTHESFVELRRRLKPVKKTPSSLTDSYSSSSSFANEESSSLN